MSWFLAGKCNVSKGRSCEGGRQHCATRVVLRSNTGFCHFAGQFLAGDGCEIKQFEKNMMICVGAHDIHVHVDVHVP